MSPEYHAFYNNVTYNMLTIILLINIVELITSCGKLMLLDKMLPVLRKNGSKMLIFSQMTMMLDILADYCDMRKYKFGRLDGTMKLVERQEQVSCQVLLSATSVM